MEPFRGVQAMHGRSIKHHMPFQQLELTSGGARSTLAAMLLFAL